MSYQYRPGKRMLEDIKEREMLGGFVLPGKIYAAEPIQKGSLVRLDSRRSIYERAALKRDLKAVLDAESISPEDIMELLNHPVNIRTDGAFVSNKRLLRETGPQVCSTKEQLSQSLIYSLKMSEP